MRLSKVPRDYDTSDRGAVEARLQEIHGKGEIATGLLYLDTSAPDMHAMSATADVPLARLPFEKLCPGSATLNELQEAFR